MTIDTDVTSRTTLVAVSALQVSALQSADGPVADLHARQRDVSRTARARRWHGTR
jgi:hypothetical protein